MTIKANEEKPKLTLLKQAVTSRGSLVDEFDFELDSLENDKDFKLFSMQQNDNHDLNQMSFSQLLSSQNQIIDRINYFSQEIEFNLE